MANHPATGAKLAFHFFIVLLLAVLAWRVLSLGLADADSRSAPKQALQWRAKHPAALLLLAESQVKNPELHALAKQNALASLQFYPFNGRAYRVLAQIADAEKNPQQALALYRNAERYSPRDLETHAGLLNHAIAANDADTVVLQLDSLLRLQNQLLPQLMPLIGELAAQPATQVALISILAKKPGWRTPVVNTLLSQEKAAERYAGFFDRLSHSNAGVSEIEQQAWLRALNQGKQWPLAYLSWAINLPPERQSELGNIFNGSFENELLGGEFDWQFDRVPGANIDRALRPGTKGEKALRIHFEDRRVAFNHVRQTLVLPAGRYRFSGLGLTEDLRTERGLVWEVQCLGTGLSLLVSEPWQGNDPQWQRFSLDFEVPKVDCPSQSLTLKLPARVDSERQINGSIWFDDFRIQRIQTVAQQK